MGDWRDGRGGLHWYALEQAGPVKTHHPREVGQPDWRDNVVTKIWTFEALYQGGEPLSGDPGNYCAIHRKLELSAQSETT